MDVTLNVTRNQSQTLLYFYMRFNARKREIAFLFKTLYCTYSHYILKRQFNGNIKYR